VWRGTALVVFNLLLLFVVCNVAAQVALLLRDGREYSPAKYYHRPSDLYETDLPLLRRSYPGHSDADIAELIQPPNITGHPVLGFMERPIRSKHYNVGLENMRYTGRIREENARGSLDGSVWMMGGSTLFGHGVSDTETIPAQMGLLDPSRTYVNFGVQGYDSWLELEKLIILLKKGYRPERVVFLDGLNDMLGSLSTSFAPAEAPMLRFTAYAHHFHAGTFDRQRGWGAFARTLPLTRWIMELQIDASDAVVGHELEDLDDPASLYHTEPWLHFKKTRSSPYLVEAEALPHYGRKTVERLKQNGAIARALGRALGFEVVAVFQPIGLLSLENRFVRDPSACREGEPYRILAHLTEAVRTAIARGELDMIDLSRAADDCPDCYVDLAHYDAKLSRILAERILGGMTQP
jgi:hypothetical protein